MLVDIRRPRTPQAGGDDAQIFFSYSPNLAAERGLVYANNPEHVEAATSLLWTLICAIPFRLGFTGGDHFVGYRFYQPAYPVMVLAAGLTKTDVALRICRPRPSEMSYACLGREG